MEENLKGDIKNYQDNNEILEELNKFSPKLYNIENSSSEEKINNYIIFISCIIKINIIFYFVFLKIL